MGTPLDSKPILNIVLVAPEIPYNTGNIIRLCANVGAQLHLVEPLGFQLNNPRLRRAALDYRDLTDIVSHSSVDDFLNLVDIATVYGAVTDGQISYTEPEYHLGDTILFGSESVGLADNVVSRLPKKNRLWIPMKPNNRSLNLSNAAAIIVYEMWRQLGFSGASTVPQENRSYFS